MLEKLATLPAPDEVLALRPSAALQARVAELLEKQRHERLSDTEEREFAEVEYIEHVVRMAKGRARRVLHEYRAEPPQMRHGDKWPNGFFENIAIDDPAFERPEQGSLR